MTGAKILIVEDEPVAALDMETTLDQAGYKVVGVAGSVDKALDIVQRIECDIAILDTNLRGESVEEVAKALRGRGKPFLFVSGYGRVYMPASFMRTPLVSKPFEPGGLVKAVEALLA